MNVFRLPGSVSCPACKKDLSLAHPERGEVRKPKAGDQTVCGYCLTYLRYVVDGSGKGLELEVIGLDEFESLPEVLQSGLMQARGLILARKHADDVRGREEPHVPPSRSPKHGFGAVLVDPHGFKGRVDSIYADYKAALDNGAVPRGWFEVQDFSPSTKDQIFYGLVGMDGRGAVMVGELDVEEGK